MVCCAMSLGSSDSCSKSWQAVKRLNEVGQVWKELYRAYVPNTSKRMSMGAKYVTWESTVCLSITSIIVFWSWGAFFCVRMLGRKF